MPDDILLPHLNGLPPAEATEELQLLDALVDLFLLEPILDFNEEVRLAVDVVTKSLPADHIVLEVDSMI